MEKDKLVHAWESKAMYEYSAGTVHDLRGDPAAARAAYERALSEDLSFYMAHAALADLALRGGDTATALNEYGLAVQIKEDDPALRFGYAMALLKAARPAEAATQFAKATELEPYFAMPYYYLGRLYDNSEMTAEARAQYEAFLARAARMLPEYAWVESRLRALSANTPPAANPPPER
jgi:Tfp pilus assembly protein PilF